MQRLPCRTTGNTVRRQFRGGPRRFRRGAILVWFALLLLVLLGMVGLVIDAGLLMAGQRHAQNAADAAALAAAHDLMAGKSNADAIATANTFVTTYNGIATAPTVNIPPASGPYAGMPNYVEVIANSTHQTYFIHVLPGVSSSHTVGARAVAGSEAITAGEGVAVLDPNARPGLNITGGGTLKVLGKVIVNSEGGGIDENHQPVAGTQLAGSASNNSTCLAKDIHVVGGVDRPENFDNIDPSDPTNVLHCRQLPIPDPLINLPTPAVSDGTRLGGGVDPTLRGDVHATNQGYKIPANSGNGKYMINGVETLVLCPGIYSFIDISGGNVWFLPGIYVIQPNGTTTNTFIITGGTVTADGVMFYNTGDSYNAQNGTPDVFDGNNPPVGRPSDLGDSTQYWGSFQINAAMKFSPLDHKKFAYPTNNEYYQGTANPSTVFDGMLFYQRRRNDSSLIVTGNSEAGLLAGTLYAKWARTQISGQGTYDAQFVVGSMTITGQGNVTLNYAGEQLGKAPHVFLVE